MACEEMQLYYAYLDAVEEEKRKSQPWQCEVTVIAPADEPIAAKPVAAKPVAAKPATAAARRASTAKTGFACDDPE